MCSDMFHRIHTHRHSNPETNSIHANRHRIHTQTNQSARKPTIKRCAFSTEQITSNNKTKTKQEVRYKQANPQPRARLHIQTTQDTHQNHDSPVAVWSNKQKLGPQLRKMPFGSSRHLQPPVKRLPCGLQQLQLAAKDCNTLTLRDLLTPAQ